MRVRETIDLICPSPFLDIKRRVEGSPVATRLARGTFWSLVGAVLSRSLGLVASLLVARTIGKRGMGELGMIQSTIGMFSSLAGLGLGLAATRHIAKQRVRERSIAGETIGFLSLLSWISGASMAIVVLVLAPTIARNTMAEPGLVLQLQLGAPLLFFGVINGVQTGVLSGFEAFKRIARVNLLAGLSNFCLVVGGAYAAGLSGTVCGLVAGLAVNCSLNFFAVRRETATSGVTISFKNFHRHWNLLWGFGVPAMLSGLISGPVGWISSAILVRQPGGYGEMGIYNATNGWFQAVGFLPELLARVLLPVLSSYHETRDNRGTNRALVLATLVNVAVVVPAIVLGSLCSPLIIGLYGPGFAQGWPVLVLAMVSAGVLTIQGPLGNQLVASSRMWAYFSAHVVWGMIFLGGTALLVPAHGAAGLATARLIAYTANGLFVVAVTWCHPWKIEPRLAETKP